MRLKRSGFSLVLSLTIMAAMVLMVIVLASFLQVESRLAQSNAGYQRARLNALAAARIAIGHLQQTAGPDQRVTMRADMFAPDVTGAVPPTAVTVPGTVLNPNKPTAVSHQKRYWTGIWSTGGANTSQARDWKLNDPHESRLFLGWLTSPLIVDGTNAEQADKNALNYYMPNRNHFGTDGKILGGASSEGQLLINELKNPLNLSPFSPTAATPFVRLVGGSAAVSGQPVSGSVQWPASATSAILQEFYGAIDLPTMPLPGPTLASGTVGARGRFAYWIGDEGIKAKVNLPDPYATSNTGASMPGLTDWDKGFAGSAAQRSAFESVTPSLTPVTAALLPANFSTKFLSLRNNDVLSAAAWNLLRLPSTGSRQDLAQWANRQGGAAAADDVTSATRLLWHDVTPYSFSVLSDTLNGGLKADLSTAFELPYAVFRTLEVYPGQKNTTVTTTAGDRRQSFFHGAPNSTFNVGMGGDLDYNRPNLLDKIGSPLELLKATPRAPEWAPRYLSTISSIGSTISLVKSRNGNETPERLGFAYEVPLASNFFNNDRIGANLVSLTAATNNRTLFKNDALPWSDITFPNNGDPKDHPDNWTGRIVRGPTWDLYRNFYRMYKREVEAAATDSTALRGQGAPADDLGFIVRGVEPLTYATGNRGLPTRRAGPAAGDAYASPVNPVLNDFYSSGGAATNYFHRNNLADGGIAPLFQAERRFVIPFDSSQVGGGSTPDALSILPRHRTAASPSFPTKGDDNSYDNPQVNTTRTWPTSPSLAPTILRFSTVYSAVRQGNQLGMTVDPIVVIHNPYDVALEFEGLAMVTSGMSTPFRFIFRAVMDIESTEYQYAQMPTTPPTVPPLPPANKQTNQTIDFGDAVIGGGENDNRSMSFRIVAGSGGTTGGGRVIRLEPGEIKVVGTAPSADGLVNNINTNVSIPGAIGFDLSSRAFFKMTPFHNVRSRMGSGSRNQNAERVMWTMDFDICKIFAEYNNAGNWITWTNVGLNDIEYARRLNDLWNAVKSQRRVHDAMRAKGLDGLMNTDDDLVWDGSLPSLEGVLGGKSIQVLTRNQGWINYNGYVVGTEGEVITTGPGPDAIWGNADDTETYTRNASRYVAPTRRNGRVSLQGQQSWNFYLIGKKSIDGLKELNTHRRWFGSPDEDATTYIPDPVNPNRLIRRYAEGSETINGFNTVDESLLLNFQAMTSGWPMYSNSNGDSAYYTQTDQEWTRALGFNPPTPSYYIKGSNLNMGVPMDPEFNTGNGKGLEVTQNKADSLANSRAVTLTTNESKLPVFMVDFVRRAADSDDTTNKWYPTNYLSAGFGMNPTAPSAGTDRMQTPPEMRNAPMTPYFISDRAQQAQLFGYDGKAHTPIGWTETQRVLNGSLIDTEFPVTPGKDGAYWGNSVNNDTIGKSNVILYPIPRRPLLSLAQLGTVAFAETNVDADFTVGSSFAHPGIGDLTRIIEWPGPRELFPSESTLAADIKGPVPELGYVAKHMGSRPVRNRASPRVDHAFAANLTLWDSYYFSGLNLQANSFTHLDGTTKAWPSSGPDLPIDANVRTSQKDALTNAGLADPSSFTEYKLALDADRSLLANKRMAYIPDGKPSYTSNALYKTQLQLPESEFPHPKYLARNSFYDGGFNVNSTSKAAWKAVLAGLRGQVLPDGSGNTTATALTKFARAFGAADAPGNSPWTSYRELNDIQIDELAGFVVAEVRNRGPFMSLADFVNRRLVNNDSFGLKGALQAAIDKSSINTTAIAAAGGVFSAPATPSPGSNWYDPNTIHGDNSGATATSWWRETTGYPKIPANNRFPSLKAMSRTNSPASVTAALGAPGIVTQMDILNSVGPNLTARSDTFVVRAYGEALDDVGNVIGKAWVEVVVQRTVEYVAMAVGRKYPEYAEPTRRKLNYRVNTSGGKEYDSQVTVETYEPAPFPNPPGSTPGERTALVQEQKLNRILGRRFRPTGLRWLSANEI